MATHTEKPGLRTRPRGAAAALVLTVAALLLAACGSGDDVDPGNAEDAPDYSAMVASAPPELDGVYDAGGAGLIGSGAEDYERQLADLEGLPVVVNAWASWCGPCRTEFPHFQETAAEMGDEVAFLGVDVDDSDSAATTFLESHPIPYGSISDPDKDIANDLGLGSFLPATIFYNARGERTYTHTGPYANAEDLAADIERYAVKG